MKFIMLINIKMPTIVSAWFALFDKDYLSKYSGKIG